MAGFLELLDRLDRDPRVRGTQFEHLCKWFLENDPTYRATLRRVWLWDEWPGRWGTDAGIDLVAEDHQRRLWAIQSKAYAADRAVTKADVNTFLSESSRSVFSFRLLIATTDKLHHIARRTIDDQEKQVAFIGLADLLTSGVDWPAAPNRLRPSAQPKPATPRPHQQKAIRDVVKGFTTAERGQLVMACGTGKTLTSLFIRQELDAHRTLVLLPSLSLLKQTVQEWQANATVQFEALPVCSDDTVTPKSDDAVTHASELGVPVTTDPAEISAFLRRRSGPRVVFSTYQSSPQIAAAFALGRVPAFDLVVADEAHRVAGSETSLFATVLDAAAIRARRRLFMTATPRYYTGRVRKAAQDSDMEVASMDDPTRFGHVFHRLTFGEAIRRKLLTDYQVAIVGVDHATYRDWAQRGTLVSRDGGITDARTLASQIGLAKAMRKYDLHRVISFHSRVARAREFAAELPRVVEWMPARQRPKGTVWTKHASGTMTAGERHILLQRLRQLDDGKRGLLANARCLSEGVDVPTLDGVAFIDPRRSEVDIVQAVGRAIRKSQDKTVGTIVIPIFIDTDTDPEAALDSSLFKPVWDVIQALRAHDTELGEQLDALRRELGREGGRPRLPDKIHIDLPATIGIDFARAFDVHLVEQTTQRWEFMFGLLERYVAEHGAARVRANEMFEGYRLGAWVVGQRVAYDGNRLDFGRRLQLETLPGWTWDPFADKWEAVFNVLLSYLERNGAKPISQNCVVDGIKLGSWVTQQRMKRTNGTLDANRERRLDEVPGWSWNPKDDRWSDGLRRLRDHLDRGGGIPPKLTIVDGFRVGSWVDVQRREYAKGRLRPARQRTLEELPGWAWQPNQDKWEQWFGKLQSYVEQHGDALVPDDCRIDGTPIGKWVGMQRRLHATGKLSADRAERLACLPGWNWNPATAQWEAGFEQLVEHVKTHGNARVPFGDGTGAGRWVAMQREKYRKGSLAPEWAERLEQLEGWTWQANQDRWEQGFTQLCEYVAQHGNAQVLANCTISDFDLGRWVLKQRTRYGKGLLESERVARLEGLPGWSWDPHSEKWEKGFRHLEAYTAQSGVALVPAAYLTDSGYPLGSWATRQRRRQTLGTLEPERQHRLELLVGWAWKAQRGPVRP